MAFFGIFNDKESLGKKAQSSQQRYAGSYFRGGLDGLTASDREQWEKDYAKEITGLSASQKNDYFKNTVFRDLFKDSDNEEDQRIWNNRGNLSKRERDILVAQKANSIDIDGLSDIKENSVNIWDYLSDADYKHKATLTKLYGQESAREGASKFLQEQGQLYGDRYYDYLNTLDSSELNKKIEEFDIMSDQTSNYFKMYSGTDKLNLSEDDKKKLLAEYLGDAQVGGEAFAAKMLANKYQDIVASNQSELEKVWNSGAQFIDSATGMIIRAVGMAGGLLEGLAGAGTNAEVWESEYWKNLLNRTIDNDVTRYGDRVATTNTYDPEEQQKLSEMGLSDNPILNTVAQQNSMLSWNTPYELFGQYGFTTGSTMLSFGMAGAVNAGAKSTAWLARGVTSARGLNATEAGLQLSKGIADTKYIFNLAIPGAVGTVEGGMNAAMTKEETLRGFNDKIDAEFRDKLLKQYQEMGLSEETAINNSDYLLKTINSKNFEDINELLEGPGLSENTKAMVRELIADKMAAEESANSAMYWDFANNSLINGFLNSTLGATLQAPSVQRSLRQFKGRIGLETGNPLDDAVTIRNINNRWSATAKKGTTWEVVKDRLRESLSEGLEEYNQDLSSAFGQAYAEDLMQQYFDHKYNSQAGSAMEYDYWQSFGAGMNAIGETALSSEAIKSGLYGGLSTLLGGPNANPNISNRGPKERLEGESKFGYFMRRSPITWRSAITPIFDHSERNAITRNNEAVAKRLNEFFADESVQDAFFNMEGTSQWLSDMQSALARGDEKTARDARLGAMVGNVLTIKSLEGTGYYDALMASLQARANFNEENLQDDDSAESEAVRHHLALVPNRGENISEEEALKEIKSNAKSMLDVMSKINKYGEEVEKTFGRDIDFDIKNSMVFNKLMIDNHKERMEQLDEEIDEVTAELDKNPGDASSLGSKAKLLIARFGSFSKAQNHLSELEALKTEIKSAIKEIEKKTPHGREAREDKLRTLALLRTQLDDVNNEIDKTAPLIENYEKSAEYTEREDKDGKKKFINDKQVLTAEEILRLPAEARASMLNEKNKKRYSAEQQQEIDRANQVGTAIYQDFSSKIRDRGRLEADYNKALQKQYDLMNSSQALNTYARGVKFEKQKKLFKDKNSALLEHEETGNYQEFATALDRIYNTNNGAEVIAVEEMLKDSEYFKQYNKEKGELDKIISYVDRTKAVDKNDIPTLETLGAAVNYLRALGVDPTSDDAADILMETAEDEEGNTYYKFKDYFERVAQEAPEETRPTFTSIGEAVETFKNVMEGYKKEVQEREASEAPVTPAPTSPSSSAPVASPEPVSPATSEESPAAPTEGVSNIFTDGTAGTTPESGFINEDGSPQEGALGPNVQANPILQEFMDNSNEEVAKSAEIAINISRNTPNMTDEARQEAQSYVESLSKNSFDNAEDFADTLNSEANRRELNSEDGTSQVADILRQAAAKALKNKADNKPATAPTETTTRKPNIPGLNRNNEPALKGDGRFGNSTQRDATKIGSVHIDSIRRNHPNSAIAKYYNTYDIDEALMDIRDEMFEGDGPDVYLITDKTLTDETMTIMGDSYSAQRDLPIVAVIEKENGPLEILGKRYQPIAVMSSTNASGVAGSDHMARIRQAAQSNNGTDLISYDGKPVVTKVWHRPIMTSRDNNLGAQYTDVIEIGLRDLDASERPDLSNMNRTERRNNKAYKKMRDRFLNRLRVRKINGGQDHEVFFALPIMKDNSSGRSQNFSTIFVKVKSLAESISPSTGQTLNQALESDEEGALANFNSRTRGFTRAIETLQSDLGNIEIVSEGIEGPYEGTRLNVIKISEGTQAVLNDMANKFAKRVGNYINLDSRWSFVLTPLSNGSFGLDLINSSTGESIDLGVIDNDNSSLQQIADEALAMLIFDEDYNIRERAPGLDFVRWQVPHSSIERMATDRRDRETMEDIYDDGILTAAATSFQLENKGLAIRNPFNNEGKPLYKPTEVANPDNAQRTAPLNEPTIVANNQAESGGSPITDTGIPLTNNEPKAPESPAQQRAKEVVNRIIEDSKYLKLSDDESHYIDTRTGKRYARVTSTIVADENAPVNDDGTPERLDPNDAWVLPSTTIGTGIDEFVRDFFSGKLDGIMDKLEQNYPNASQSQLERLAGQLQTLKNNLTARGLTIISRDIAVTGQVDVTDKDGNVHKVDIAGTLDLLAYDSEGNLHILDMKTHHSSIDQSKKDKWARQLSMYKKFIEDKYGLPVKSLEIIPIKVEYDTPKGKRYKGRLGTADYSVDENNKTQLLKDKRPFKNSKPVLEPNIPIEPVDLNLQWEKLTDEERASFQDVVSTASAESGETIAPQSIEVAENTEESEYSEDEDLGKGLLSDMLGIEVEDTGFEESDRPISPRLQWGVWEGFRLDDGSFIWADETQRVLENFYTEEQWNKLTDEEKEHELKCKGVSQLL